MARRDLEDSSRHVALDQEQCPVASEDLVVREAFQDSRPLVLVDSCRREGRRRRPREDLEQCQEAQDKAVVADLVPCQEAPEAAVVALVPCQAAVVADLVPCQVARAVAVVALVPCQAAVVVDLVPCQVARAVAVAVLVQWVAAVAALAQCQAVLDKAAMNGSTS